MTLAGAQQLVAAATARSRAVPAFNVIMLEQAEAVVAAAEQTGIPLLLQVSENAIAFRRGFAALLAACRELAEAATVPIGVHIDHLQDEALAEDIIARASDLGVGSLMFDAATLDYADNAALTARVAADGHARGLWVEGELGAIGGKGGAHAPGVRTHPDEAVAFVRETGVDALAVAVGSTHAMRDRSARLDVDLVARLAAAVSVPLVLHGSSGVADAALSDAVDAGIRKVNVGTALGIAGTAALRGELAAHPDAVDPRVYLRGMRDATRDAVIHLAGVVG
ncbi:class II fructose-bisphosphate aldolase [Microbacterium kribbense]|uniref:Class II fructose-bisphosphate aldolase n=1 Tax=Microbacterium kribbense TaxID=433645 RepID=A0ABP7GVR9_9MICO